MQCTFHAFCWTVTQGYGSYSCGATFSMGECVHKNHYIIAHLGHKTRMVKDISILFLDSTFLIISSKTCNVKYSKYAIIKKGPKLLITSVSLKMSRKPGQITNKPK